VIGLYAKVPYHAQIRSSEPQLAEKLAEAAEKAAAAFAGTLCPSEESFFMTFDESSRPCRLRAAEAARALSASLRGLGPRLLGWAVVLDSGSAGKEEALERARRLWYGVQGDGLYLSERAADSFAGYFEAELPQGPRRPGIPAVLAAREAVFARPTLPFDPETALGEGTRDAEAALDAVGGIVTGQDPEAAIAVLGPGATPSRCLDSALAKLYPAPARPFLRLRSSAVENPPYAPLTDALAELLASYGGGPGPGSLLSGAERALLEDLAPVLEFLGTSPYRHRCSPGIDVRLGICAAAALRLYAREMRSRSLPALVILEGIERFPRESLSLVIELAAERLRDELLVIVACGSRLPESWAGLAARRVEVSGPGPMDMARAALAAAEAAGDASAAPALAMAAAGDPVRLRLALRIASTGGRLSAGARAEELAARALSTFPLEYAELLLALRLGEEVLTDEGMEGFLDSMGYVPGIRPIVYSALGDLGLIGPGRRPRIRSREAAASAEEALPDGGAAVKAAFSARLLALRESRSAMASVAFFRRVYGVDGADEGRLPLLYDCLASDAAYGPSEPEGERPVDSPIWPLGSFFDRYAAGGRDESLASLERLESAAARAGGPEGLAAASASLGRAAFDYADGRIQAAAARAKSALISLHDLGASRAEARAHRLMGLCSLAQGDAQEGSDYLANAFDLASAAPDPMECALSALGEAAALLTLGDVGRASRRAEAAEDWARAAFRADWEAAASFVRGRASLELGRSAEAEERLGTVRALARIYGLPAAAARAEIWTGRAAALAGDGERAAEMLSRHPGDVEAAWFRAEAEYWGGSAARAFALASEALERAPRPGFASADAFDWSSGFASVEGRVVGFSAGRTYLADQILAFREFAAGIADPARESAARAASLSSLAREDRIAALHPSAHLYAFYRYLVLEAAAPGSMDATTALSKAFKALQLRSARVSESSLKDGFMEANRWNGAIVAAARSRKLI
jgi:hypothetical protein